MSELSAEALSEIRQSSVNCRDSVLVPFAAKLETAGDIAQLHRLQLLAHIDALQANKEAALWRLCVRDGFPIQYLNHDGDLCWQMNGADSRIEYPGPVECAEAALSSVAKE